MAIQLSTAHETWTCRWSQATCRPLHEWTPTSPRLLWVCGRTTGVRRFVTNEECRNCPYWERNYSRAE
jgi:hypothetical protein